MERRILITTAPARTAEPLRTPSFLPRVDPPSDPLINRVVDLPIEHTVNPPIDPLIDKPTDSSDVPSYGTASDKSVDIPIDPLIDKSVDPSVAPPFGTASDQPVDPPVAPPFGTASDHPVDPPVAPPFGTASDQPTNPPVEPKINPTIDPILNSTIDVYRKNMGDTYRFPSDTSVDIVVVDEHNNIVEYFAQYTLYDAINQGDFLSVKEFVERNPSDINKMDRYGNTALVYALEKNNTEIINYLTEKGAVIDDFKNISRLLNACSTGNINLVKSVIKRYKVDINSVDLDGNSALFTAVENHKFDLVKYLISIGVDMDIKKNGKHFFDYVVETNDSDMIYYFIDNKSFDIFEKYSGISVIVSAIKSENIQLLNYLIEKRKFDVNKEYDGIPLLVYAIRSKNVDIIRYIIENSKFIDYDKLYDGKNITTLVLELINKELAKLIFAHEANQGVQKDQNADKAQKAQKAEKAEKVQKAEEEQPPETSQNSQNIQIFGNLQEHLLSDYDEEIHESDVY